LDKTRVIDVDSHVSEPPDLWTSRIPAKWGDQIPHVRRNEETGIDSWFIGDERISDVAGLAYAEWKNPPPYAPPTLEEATPGAWQAKPRLEWMNRHGIYAQVIYPNILGFIPPALMRMENELRLECVRAYNDFQTEFCSEDPERLLPMTYLPWWDVQASIAELERGANLGHRGVIFPWEFEKKGLPPLRAAHWEPLLRAIEEMGLPMSFHIGFGEEAPINKEKAEDVVESLRPPTDPARQTGGTANPLAGLDPLDIIGMASKMLIGNADCIVELIMSKICHRYPNLKFVSVESGIGYLPYLIDGLDWHFKNTAAASVHSEMLLPSEYFARQIYGTFWFESDIARLGDLWPDNFMFETDYPHPTSVAPGPNTTALSPRDTIIKNCAGLPNDVLVKILQDNAASLYRVRV
jgi:predicted TIM-barrel fold metal-dependent hydrolase